MAKSGKIYAVVYQDGQVGYFTNWSICQQAMEGHRGMRVKGFKTHEEAAIWASQELTHPLPVEPRKPLTSPPEGLNGDATGLILEQGVMQIFVDGSFVDRCPMAGWGWVAVLNGVKVAEGMGVTKEPAESRNIDGELEAVIQAMEWASGMGYSATIHHDYLGISKWPSGEWRAKAGVSIRYLVRAKQHLGRFTFNKVKAHSGVKWNEYADFLAGKAITDHLMSTAPIGCLGSASTVPQGSANAHPQTGPFNQ